MFAGASLPRPTLFDYYPIKSAIGQKNTKNFW
jgi:hypothetical protein